jgi:hypothetical protein
MRPAPKAIVVAVAVMLAGCGSAPRSRTPIEAFNQCVRNAPVDLLTSDAPTRARLELIARRSDNYAIATVSLLDSRREAEEFAYFARSDSQLVVVRDRYVVAVYSGLPPRYAAAIDSCTRSLAAAPPAP